MHVRIKPFLPRKCEELSEVSQSMYVSCMISGWVEVDITLASMCAQLILKRIRMRVRARKSRGIPSHIRKRAVESSANHVCFPLDFIFGLILIHFVSF